MDVARSIPVSIMMYAAHRTIPFTNAQVFYLSILITAIRTNLTGRKEFVYSDNSCASLPAYIDKDILEFGEPVVHDLPAVAFLHEFHIQVLKADDCVAGA